MKHLTMPQTCRGPCLANGRATGFVYLLVALVLWPAQPAAAVQSVNAKVDSIEIRTAPCATCRITLQPISTLGGPHPDNTLVPFASLAVTSRGEVIIGAVQTGGEVVMVSSRGGAERLLNRTGTGPGELRRVTNIAVGAGDTVYVLDVTSRWMHRVSPTGEFIDRTLLPGGINHFLPLGGRRLFAAAAVPSRNAAGYPLHVIDTMGIVASFGDETDLTSPRAAGKLVRHLARGRGDTMWAANRLSYKIEQWTTDGRRTGVLTRTVDWFPPSVTPPNHSPPVARPQTTMRGVFDTGDGYLWVYISVADRAWKAKQLKPSPLQGMFVPESVLDPFLDTIIEVIDLRRNVVVASYRDGRALIPLDQGYLASYEEDEHGNPTYRILRPHLSGSTRSP